MKKWIPNVFLPHELELLAGYLETQAAKGWILQKVGMYGFLFEKSESRRLRFCVDIPSTQRKRGGSNDYLQPYYEMCEESGWLLVGTNMLVHIFVTEDLAVPMIHTDPSVQFEAAQSFLKERVGLSAIVLVVMAILVLPTLPWVLQEKDGTLIAVAGVVLLGLLYVGEAVYSYYQWQRQRERACITGDWNTSIHHQKIIVRSILRIAYTLGLLIAYSWMIKRNLEMTELTSVVDIVGLLLEPPFRTITILGALYLGRKFFWKRGLDETSGRAISAVILSVAMLFLLAGASLLQDYLDSWKPGVSAQVKLEKMKEAPFTGEMLGIDSSYDAITTQERGDNYVSLEYIQILDGGGSL